MTAPARAAAFRVLREIAVGRGDLGEALTRSRDPLPDARDRALATDLAIGTLRWRLALDYQLRQRSAKPLDTLDPPVLDALRLGAYQLLYLERLPTSAIVNDSVEIVKHGGFRSAAPFANAVLRRLARERETLTWPDRSDLARHLSVVHSHPLWLVDRWIERYGAPMAERWVRFNNEPPALTLAVNRLLTTRTELSTRLASEGVRVDPTAVAPHGVVVVSGQPLTSTAFREGDCVVQDEASQLIPELVDASPGSIALDLCASPGGKTIALAAQTGADGRVVASDVRWRRMRTLAATLARCRAVQALPVQIHRSAPLPFRAESMDRVLIDAPCSGLGTIRRDPDIRWRRTALDLPAMAETQLDLLRRAAPVVARGGRLIYSTCSSEPEENEAVVARFLHETASFELVPIAEVIPPALAAMGTPEGYLRTGPQFGLEAFFGAILRKR